MPLAGSLVLLLVLAGCAREQSPSAQHSSTPARETPARAAASRSQEPESGSQPPDKKATAAEPKPDKPAQSAPEDGPKLETTTRGPDLTWHEDGQVRMTAHARELTGDEVTKTATLLDFSAQLYENGKLTATMSAPKAVADTVARVVTATGGVTVKSLERETVLNASWVRWYARKQKVVGNGGVKIKSTMGTIDAAAFVADTGLKTFTAKDSAKGLDLQ